MNAIKNAPRDVKVLAVIFAVVSILTFALSMASSFYFLSGDTSNGFALWISAITGAYLSTVSGKLLKREMAAL